MRSPVQPNALKPPKPLLERIKLPLILIAYVAASEWAAERRSLRYEMRLLLVGLIVVLKLNLPDEVTIPAVAAVVLKTLWGIAVGFRG